MNLNKTQIIGRLGRPPEMRYTPSGQAVTNLSVAVSKSYTDNSGQKVESTMWMRVSAWGKLAESCNQYLVQGQEVYVEGELTFDSATGSPKTFTKNDGTHGASFEMRAFTVQFGAKPKGAEQPSQQQTQTQNYGQSAMQPPQEDSMPF